MSPNVNDLNDYITATDVSDGDILTFTNSGRFVDVDYSRAQDGSDVKTVLEIEVELPNGKKKLISPNRTSRNSIAEEYSADTENWVNKSVKVELLKQNVRGNIKSVIYLKPATI